MPVLPKPRPNLFLEGLESLGGLGKTAAGFLREDDPSMSAFDLAGPLGVASQAAKKAAAPFGSGLADFASRNLKKFVEGSKVPTVYHGTVSTKDFNIFKMSKDADTKPFDAILGTHVSETPEIANKFAEDVYKRQPRAFGRDASGMLREDLALKPGDAGGRVLKLHADIRNPKVIDQTRKYAEHSDQYAIAADLWDTVGNDKSLFVAWAERARNITKKEAEDLFEKLSKGMGDAEGHFPRVTPGEYIADHDSAGFLLPKEGPYSKVAVAKMYKKKLKEQGYDAIKYQNTAPLETRGVRNKTSYIVFEPTQLKSATGNRGTFDPTNPSIIAGLGGAAALSSQQTPPQRPRHPTQAQNGPQP